LRKQVYYLNRSRLNVKHFTKHQRGQNIFQQVIVGAVANLGTISSGMSLGFSAVALPAMQAAHHSPHVSEEQASWIGE
jgi:hypothetical protein